MQSAFWREFWGLAPRNAVGAEAYLREREAEQRASVEEQNKRMDLLGDRMSAIERRFTKLQGEVSREWRDRYERADVEYDDEDVEP